MRAMTRLSSIALLTAGLYLSATFWCTAPARAADVPGEGDVASEEAAAASYGASGAGRVARPVDVPQEEPVDPQAYVVGPGDLLALQIWGRQNFTYPLKVDPVGRIFILNVGPIKAAGLTLAQLEKSVGAKVRVTYPRLNNALTLVRPRSFLVQVAGLVKHPEAYRVSALTRVSRVVALAGGHLVGGSRANIEVRRAGKTIRANLQPFYLRGDRSQNPTLVEGDVVFVPPASFQCVVGGAVYRTGIYELEPGQTLGDLVDLAGGLSTEASATLPVLLTRRLAGDRMETLKLAAPRDPAIRATPLRHGDQVFFPSVHEVQRSVIVQGAIAVSKEVAAATGGDRRLDSPGAAPREFTVSLPFRDGDTARVVIERAGGLLPWADARNAFVERRGPDGKEQRLDFDARALIVLRDLTHDVKLRAGDVVHIPAEREGVMVAGPVYRPGLYQHSPRYTALDYINLAGGPTPNGSSSDAVVISPDGKRRTAEKGMAVAPGDTIAVQQKFLTTFEWVQILLTIASLSLSATALAITLKQ